MSFNINKARGDAIIAEIERFGYRVYLHENQIRVSPTDQTKDAPHRHLPTEVSAQLNNYRGSILIALQAKKAEAKKAEAELPVVPVEPVIKAPGFGDNPRTEDDADASDPILTQMMADQADATGYGAE